MNEKKKIKKKFAATFIENKIRQYTRDLICAVEHCHEIANIIHKDINVNKIGNGFSRILNLVNVNSEKNENDKGLKIENNEKDNKNIFNETRYKKNKKIMCRNVNTEATIKTVPSCDEVMNGLKTQRLKNSLVQNIRINGNIRKRLKRA